MRYAVLRMNTEPLFFVEVTDTSLFDWRFVRACTAPYRAATFNNATCFITDKEDTDLSALHAKRDCPVILISPNEYNHGTGVPAMRGAFPKTLRVIAPVAVRTGLEPMIRAVVAECFLPAPAAINTERERPRTRKR